MTDECATHLGPRDAGARVLTGWNKPGRGNPGAWTIGKEAVLAGSVSGAPSPSEEAPASPQSQRKRKAGSRYRPESWHHDVSLKSQACLELTLPFDFSVTNKFTLWCKPTECPQYVQLTCEQQRWSLISVLQMAPGSITNDSSSASSSSSTAGPKNFLKNVQLRRARAV